MTQREAKRLACRAVASMISAIPIEVHGHIEDQDRVALAVAQLFDELSRRGGVYADQEISGAVQQWLPGMGET